MYRSPVGLSLFFIVVWSIFNLRAHTGEEIALYRSLLPLFQQLKGALLYCEARKSESILQFSADLDKIVYSIHRRVQIIAAEVFEFLLLCLCTRSGVS